MSVKWKKEWMNELIDEQRQEKVWNLWENQLSVRKADDWRFALRYNKRKKPGWETVIAKGTVSENCRPRGEG